MISPPKTTILLATAFAILTGSTFAIVVQDEHQPRKVTRVKRPVFTQKDWDGIYFENLFEQGLEGDRPTAEQMNPKSAPALAANDQTATTPAAAGVGWSTWIAPDVLEDEVKSIQLDLERNITTPLKFKSEYLKSRQSFAILSLMFAVIREYDRDDVRWKQYAPVAQVVFARAAAASRVGSEQAYQNAKLRKEDLLELVRGGTFAVNDKTPEELDWSQVVDRSPVMVRLQSAIDQLKPMTANKTEFTGNIEVVYRQANIIASIGEALTKEGMDDADEAEYAAIAKTMKESATSVVNAVKNQDFDAAAKSVNLIEQSCSNCHADWR